MLSLAAGFQKLHFNICICWWHFCLTPTTKNIFQEILHKGTSTSQFFLAFFIFRVLALRELRVRIHDNVDEYLSRKQP